MKKKKVTKLWQGKFVSVRDYEVKAAIKKRWARNSTQWTTHAA